MMCYRTDGQYTELERPGFPPPERSVEISIQILSLEVVLQRLDLEHGGKHQDADLEHRPPHGSHVYSFGFSVKPDLLLLHVVRLVEDLGELVVQLHHFNLEPVLC